MNQANFLIGYEVIFMIIALVITKEKSLGTDFNQDNWMLVIWLEKFDKSVPEVSNCTINHASIKSSMIKNC